MPKNVKQSDEILPLFIGKTTDIKLPSGRIVKIRETNGDDDELLSSLNASLDGSNTYNFLSAIILNDSFLGRRPMPDDIKEWHINDKYVLLFKQRIFNHGFELKFKSTCDNEKCLQENIFTEDLKQWDIDLDKVDKNTQYKSKSIKPYPMGAAKEVEFVISSGKKLKYEILTGELEKDALELKDATKNSPLVIRRLKIENKGEWIRVSHFAGFSSKEMSEIRSNIKLNDEQFDPMVHFTCPNPQCGKQNSVSLFAMGAFFYPEEMI
jgi:hypothetical protein